MVSTLKRDDILSVKDIQLRKIKIPEWNGDVYVKSMTALERGEFEMDVLQARGKGGTLDISMLRAKLASLTICDENGKRLFTEADIKELINKSAAALHRVFVVAQKLSRIADGDMAELIEGLEKDPSDGSPSA